jgi:hypothetical protein
VVTDDKLTGALSFSDNQCKLETQGQVKAIVELSAPRLNVSNNIVRRLGEQDAMHLNSHGNADRPQATVIGNISFGNIRLNGGDLPAAFKPLNILSQ